MLIKNGKKYYSTKELCKMFNVYGAYINAVMGKPEAANIDSFSQMVKDPIARRMTFYEEETIDYLENYIKRNEEIKAKAKLKREGFIVDAEELAELKRQHPLVTDTRCFNLNWWPDTEPAIFTK